MLFLVFDIELVLLLPVAVSLYAIDTYGFYIAILFFIILIIGFIFEIGVGAISIKPSNLQKETYNHNSSFYLINPLFVYKLKVFYINRSNYYKEILYILITEWKYHQTGILPYYFEDYFRNEKFQDFLVLGILSTCVLLSTIFFGITKYPL
jgi:NADH-ubiquinone/plastoquinone oxidoreductase subunit 3